MLDVRVIGVDLIHAVAVFAHGQLTPSYAFPQDKLLPLILLATLFSLDILYLSSFTHPPYLYRRSEARHRLFCARMWRNGSGRHGGRTRILSPIGRKSRVFRIDSSWTAEGT
ncbi:hypothetical protein FKP32DRAFT_497727 [Trametes sanguinea]|nr:hypothetical protein FKP32DRAFT_497727 [Trametes sanguinea]